MVVEKFLALNIFQKSKILEYEVMVKKKFGHQIFFQKRIKKI
jgi:hypothetical protein